MFRPGRSGPVDQVAGVSPPFVGVDGAVRLREAAPRRAVDDARFVTAERDLRAGLPLAPGDSAPERARAAAAAFAPGLGPGFARGFPDDVTRAEALREALRDVFFAVVARAEVFGLVSVFALGLALFVSDSFAGPLDEPALLRSSPPFHLPDIIRCAASATASATKVPSRDALFITDVAALVALSAASNPASRILRRAVGLAASAAAAAVNPAAIISRLTAAFAIRSIVVSLPPSVFLLAR